MGSQKRNSRTNRVLNLLRARRGQDVPAYEVAQVGGLQYGARVHALRQRGYVIVNRDEWHSGTRVSWFRLEEPVAARYASGKFGAAAYRK
jgi:hypothetical protein